MAAPEISYANYAQQMKNRGTAQPVALDMEPCPVCGTFIRTGSACDHQLPNLLVTSLPDN